MADVPARCEILATIQKFCAARLEGWNIAVLTDDGRDGSTPQYRRYGASFTQHPRRSFQEYRVELYLGPRSVDVQISYSSPLRPPSPGENSSP